MAGGACRRRGIDRQPKQFAPSRFGEPDNGRHPNVGAVMLVLPNLPNLPNPAQFLSGTLIAPNLFLTAGHGTDYLEWLRDAGVVTFDNVFVTFSDDPTDKASYLRIKAIRTHPGYKAGQSTDRWKRTS